MKIKQFFVNKEILKLFARKPRKCNGSEELLQFCVIFKKTDIFVFPPPNNNSNLVNTNCEFVYLRSIKLKILNNSIYLGRLVHSQEFRL